MSKNWFNNLSQILLALLSLIVSIVALFISYDAIILSSQSITPRINFELKENGLKIQNKDVRIFDLYIVSLVEINTLGFWDSVRNGEVIIPFIKESHVYGDGLFNEPLPKNNFFLFTDSELIVKKAFDATLYDELNKYINENYSLQSELGYAAPVYFKQRYYLSLVYINKFNELKKVNYVQTHIHGGGYLRQMISEEEYNLAINSTQHPIFKSIQDYMDYFNNRFFTEY